MIFCYDGAFQLMKINTDILPDCHMIKHNYSSHIDSAELHCVATCTFIPHLGSHLLVCKVQPPLSLVDKLRANHRELRGLPVFCVCSLGPL